MDSLTPVDLLLALLLAGAFVLGYYEGAGRALLAILAWVFSFILAATLRAPLGDRLATYWTSFSVDYTLMLAFLIAYVAALVVCGVIIVGLTKRQALLPDSAVLDPLLGGLVALVAGVLILAGLIAGLDSVYRAAPGFGTSDLPALSSLNTLLSQSAIGRFIDGNVVPSIVTLLGPFLPEEFVRLIRG